MDSNQVVTVGLAVFAFGLLIAGWRAARWLQNYADTLKADIRADIKSVKDEFTAAQKELSDALESARAMFEQTAKELGADHQAFREKTIAEFRDLERDIAAFKLVVAQQYASKGDMQQSVQIIAGRIDGLVAVIDALKQRTSN